MSPAQKPRSTPTTAASPDATPRRRLTRAGVIDGAVALADEIGVEPLTIRRLAEALGVKPMSLYHHVANKDAILDGMVDAVFAEMPLPVSGTDWQEAVTTLARGMRTTLARHRWATPLLDSRTNPGEATLRHHEAKLGVFRSAGFSLELAGHAVATLDAFVFGFSIQEAALPAETSEDFAELAADLALPLDPDTYPHLVEYARDRVMQPGYTFAAEFEPGLSLIVNGLAAELARERAVGGD